MGSAPIVLSALTVQVPPATSAPDRIGAAARHSAAPMANARIAMATLVRSRFPGVLAEGGSIAENRDRALTLAFRPPTLVL